MAPAPPSSQGGRRLRAGFDGLASVVRTLLGPMRRKREIPCGRSRRPWRAETDGVEVCRGSVGAPTSAQESDFRNFLLKSVGEEVPAWVRLRNWRARAVHAAAHQRCNALNAFRRFLESARGCRAVVTGRKLRRRPMFDGGRLPYSHLHHAGDEFSLPNAGPLYSFELFFRRLAHRGLFGR